ncbi:Single domain Von Willebrand factor type C domain [Trinorchestia longiramus]|nr:Single domain Von Willebrand factor type C domain [Trinorchestia longiramus]
MYVDHSGSCFDASRCSLRKVGERWTVHEDCETAMCHLADNGTLYERRTRCAAVDIPSNDCYIVRVVGKPFPDCCPQLYCNDTLVSTTSSLA